MAEINVLFLVPARDFRDEEYAEPRKILEEAGYNIKVASTTVRNIRGRFGLEVTPDLQIEDVKHEGFDAIILVGGPGAQEFFRNMLAHQIVNNFYNAGRIVAAICIAPSTLANAGILKGKKATAYATELMTLKNQGAIVSPKVVPVEVSGCIVTANGPDASKEFGEAILKLLKEKAEAPQE
ncbi:MAG: DJ-1/PfpI family protein [Chloroflexi bacterium]|nr:DJ-1/PfpI family protein [Chloroflexota bacterium]